MIDFLILGGDSKLSKVFTEIFPNESISLSKKECDITNPKSLEKALRKFNGHFIINSAAITNMRECEKNPSKCFMVNTIGPGLLNLMCRNFGKKLIHISSNYALSPVNAYGMSKLFSEKLIDKDFLVIKTDFYSIYSFIPKNLIKYRSVYAYTNIYSNPISIQRVCLEIYKNRSKKGLINLFSKDCLSYFQFAKLFSKIFEINGIVYKKTYSKSDLPLALKSCIKTDINVDVKKDIEQYKAFLEND